MIALLLCRLLGHVVEEHAGTFYLTCRRCGASSNARLVVRAWQ